MPLLQARGIELSFGTRRVLRGADLIVDGTERVGLVGPNGSGKSTLLRVLAGGQHPDHGDVVLGGRVGFLDQDPTLPGTTVGDAADAAVAWHAQLRRDYEQALAGGDHLAAARIQDRLDATGWEAGHRVDAMLDRLRAPGRDAHLGRLSGGERRRVALALTLLHEPDLLVLDEPTNHLDVDAIEWLQEWLLGARSAVLLVTHDRYLLEAVAERIVEMEQGRCVSYDGSYADYLVARAERASALARADDRRLAMIAREAEWASRSPAARTTKQKARLDRLEQLRSQEGLPVRRDLMLDLSTGADRGIQLQATGLRCARGGRELLGGLDIAIGSGDRLGILGPNGAGKSTLLRILAGAEAPDRGEVIRASRSVVGVLDQQRSGFESPDGKDWTVFEAAGNGNSHVMLRGGAEPVHVATFLDRFQFPRESFDQPVSGLSGGERARLLLARLLLLGATTLLLDEPTNDLDLLTLRVLEEALLSYDGAAILVTHDRAFLDRVCNSVLVFAQTPDGKPHVVRYASREQAVRARRAAEATTPKPPSSAPPPRTPQRARKLSYKEQQELRDLPRRIEVLEAELEDLTGRLADPATYQLPGGTVAALRARADDIPREVDALFARWSELDAVAGDS